MRRIALVGLVLLFALVGGAAFALSAVTSAGESPTATVSTFESEVAVGNESADALAGSGEVVTCNDRGPMPGDAGLVGRLVVERPAGDDGPEAATYRVVVTVGDGLIRDTHTVTLKPGVSHRFLPFAVVDQPDALTDGVETTVRARVELENGTAVATASRTVTVVERDRPCEGER